MVALLGTVISCFNFQQGSAMLNEMIAIYHLMIDGHSYYEPLDLQCLLRLQNAKASRLLVEWYPSASDSQVGN